VNPTLQGYAAAVLSAGEDLSALAADLASVDQAFRANRELRVALTDTSVPPRVRRAVLEDLLSGKVGERARRAAAFAAASASPPQIPAAMTWLAAQARRAAAGEVETEPPLGHSEARARVGGFAAALFEDLSTAQLEEMEDELFRFARTVDATPALRGALTDRDLPLAVRQGVVDQLLSAKVQPATLRLVNFVLAGGRPRDTVGTLDWLVEQTARARGWRVARVRSAQDLEAEQRDRLASSLTSMVGAPVELQVTIDGTLLGGAVVEVGDLQLDASARGRLNHLREHLLTQGWEDRGYGAAQREGVE